MFFFTYFCFQLEEKEKKDQEEAERQRLEELQTKTPEVTITVVNSSGLHGVSSNASLSSRQSNSVRGNKNSKKPSSVLVEHRNDSKEEGGCLSREDAPTHVTSSASQQPPQMVTIKRVMEGNGNEPTVTITLKGATPDKDKVLFTLVNGQGDYRTSNKFIFTLSITSSSLFRNWQCRLFGTFAVWF
jgi:hypothetical protein